MAYLSLSNVTKSFGARTLFNNISFTIEANHKIGLVGINGCGKTTLFKIIQDKIEFDSGDIYKSKNTQIGYVEQFIVSDKNQNVYEEALDSFSELIQIEKTINDLQCEIEKNNGDIENLISKKHKLEEEYKDKGGYTYQSMTKSTLKGLGFKDEEISLPINSLSGGQKTKLMLAKMLLSKANLLLLDEPTNNLDIDAIEWLENFLINYKGSFIVISHDRYFLDKVTSETFELENKKLSIYSGNYTTYLKLKDEKNKALSKKLEITEKEISRIEGIIAQQVTWSQERNYKIIRSKQKAIDRLEESKELPDQEMQKMKFHFDVIAGGNQEVLKINNLKKSFDNNLLFENISIDVAKKERVFIIGPNGCGKTTLIKILQNKLSADDGTCNLGSNIKVAYYNQSQEEFYENKSILKYVWDKHLDLTQTDVRKALATFLFKGEDVNKNILELSGGEKARLALLLLMLTKSNFLILDEPTNHLDIIAREALEEALQDYEGTLLIVSHDRYFINRLATKVYRLEKESAIEYKGNYDYYISKYIPKTLEVVKKESTNKILYKEKKALEAEERKKKNRLIKVESEIATLEENIANLEIDLQKDENATDYQKALELTNQIDEQKHKLEELYKEWESLSM